MNLLSVGTVAFDKIETPYGKTDKILGGAATFIGLSASMLGVDSAIVSVVGGDFPQKHLDLLKNRNIDISGIEVVKDGKTFFWEGRYHRNMNSRDTITTELNVLADFQPKVPEKWRKPGVLMLGNLHPGVQAAVLDQMENKPWVMMDTMNFWMDNTWGELMELVKRVDILTINDEEARQLADEYSLAKAAKKILTMGPKYLVIKKGEHGALLFDENQMFFAPALPLEEVFDPTGAGDTFAGGFAAYMAKSGEFTFNNMRTGLIYGSALASFCVEKFGTERLQEITHEDLQSRLKEFKELSHYEMEI